MIPVLLVSLAAGATVQDRVMAKENAIYISAGGVWLDRSDLLTSPGVRLEVSHFLTETVALDYLKAAYFFTTETDEAADLRAATGFVSDRHRPRALVGVGGRYAFAYGKLLLESWESVVHLSVELSLHGGVLITAEDAQPALDLGLSFRVRVLDWLSLMLDYSGMLTTRTEDGAVNLGGMPALSIGARL